MAFLIEHYAGAFPLWLSPVQIMVLPISEKQKDFCLKILNELRSAGLRAKIDLDSKTLGAKIREATLQKIPYLIIIGDREVESRKISVRTREGKDLGQLTVSEFILKLKEEIEKFS